MEGNKLRQAGEKMQAIGCLLTLVITIPIILTVFLGPLGLGIGVVIAIIAIISAVSKKKK